MYCINCGKKLEEDAKFCNSCGTKIISKKKVAIGMNKERRSVLMIVVLFVAIIVIVVLNNGKTGRDKEINKTLQNDKETLNACEIEEQNKESKTEASKKSYKEENVAPDDIDITNAIKKYNTMELSYENMPDFSGNVIVMNNVDAVYIERQQTEERSNITYCTIEMSNDDCKVVMDCIYNFSYFDDKKWYPESQKIEGYSFYPLSGIDEEQAYIATVEALHAEPEVIGGFYLGKDYIYDSVYKLQLKEHITDNDNYTDKLVYDYYKSSDFCTESGVVETYYIFNTNNGSWEYSNTLDENVCYEYHPEGQWRFDINTHYYRINITDIDYVNNTALIYYRHDSYQSEADAGELIEYVQVEFEITDEGMKFSPLHVIDTFLFQTIERDAYLLLKKDTMYISSDGINYTPVTWPRYVE